MTCIVGLVEDDIVYLGGDSAGTNGNLDRSIRRNPKVFKKDIFLIGYTTSFRMGQLLEFKLNPPRYNKEDDAYKYMVCEFVESLRKCLSDGGFSKKESERESGGTFLVGFNGRLFKIHDDYQVSETILPYAACGCGSDYAMGALYILQGLDYNPVQKISKALSTSSEFSSGVFPPFTIIDEVDS